MQSHRKNPHFQSLRKQIATLELVEPKRPTSERPSVKEPDISKVPKKETLPILSNEVQFWVDYAKQWDRHVKEEIYSMKLEFAKKGETITVETEILDDSTLELN